MMNDELLLEVLDALLQPGHDGDTHGEHAERVDGYLANCPEGALSHALRAAQAILERRAGRDPISFAFDYEVGLEDAVAELRAALSSLPHHVYHGTASKHLASISAAGLVPAHSKTHWSSMVDGGHLARGVFFTSTWRSAMGWAFAASHTLKGEPRKDTVSAVVRLRASDLILERDPRARQQGCLVAQGPISTANADVIVGETRGFPRWQSLSEWVKSSPQRTGSRSRTVRSRSAS